MPKTNGGFANILAVAQQAFAVKRGRGTRHHKSVFDAAGFEAAAPKCAHLHGAVHQLDVVGGLIHAKALAVDFDGANGLLTIQ